MRELRQAAAALRNGLRLVRTENPAQEPGAMRFVAVEAGRSGSAAGHRGARAETDPSSHRTVAQRCYREGRFSLGGRRHVKGRGARC